MGRGRGPWRLLGAIGMAVLFASAGGGWLLAAERAAPVAGVDPGARDMIEVEEPLAEDLSEIEGVPEERPQLPVVPEALSTGGVELVSPEPGAVLRGIAPLRVRWANPTGYVVFRIDDKFAYATTAPFEMRWDTSSAVDGQHVVAVDAYDASARYAGGASISVVIENTIPTPPEGVLLSVKFDEHDMLNHALTAHGELSALREDETLPTGFDVLEGNLRADLSSSVLDSFYEGASALVRTRLRTASLVTEGQRQSLPEIGRYVMVQVSRNGLTIPAQTASTKPRLGLAEVSAAMRDFPVVPGDTWQSPIGVVCDLYTRRAIYVQGRHVFEGLRWFRGQECAVISSNYYIPEMPLYDRSQQTAALDTETPPAFSLELTQMRGGMRGGGGMRGEGMRGGGMRGGGMRAGGSGGATGRTGTRASRAAGQPRTGTAQRGQASDLSSAKLTGLEGTRTTYLTRRTGKVLHLEDTVLGTVQFRTASQMAKNEALPHGQTYAIELTQGRAEMRGGGMRAGGMRGGDMRGGGMRGGARSGTARGTAQAPTTQRPGAGAGANVPPRLDYGFRLVIDLEAQ